MDADIIKLNKKKNIDLMFLAQSLYISEDVFQMTTIVLVSEINNDHINGLHLF